MIAGSYNLFIEQGATFTRLIEIEYPDPDDVTIMLPYDLSGFSASMHIRRTIDSANTLVVLNNSNGRIEIQPGGVENAIRLNLSASVTSDITSDGVYDLEITDINGNVQRILKGSVTLSQQVTR
jgi:hypothetical protein